MELHIRQRAPSSQPRRVVGSRATIKQSSRHRRCIGNAATAAAAADSTNMCVTAACLVDVVVVITHHTHKSPALCGFAPDRALVSILIWSHRRDVTHNRTRTPQSGTPPVSHSPRVCYLRTCCTSSTSSTRRAAAETTKHCAPADSIRAAKSNTDGDADANATAHTTHARELAANFVLLDAPHSVH